MTTTSQTLSFLEDDDLDVMQFELMEDDPDTNDAYLIDEAVGSLAVAKLLKISNFSFAN